MKARNIRIASDMSRMSRKKSRMVIASKTGKTHRRNDAHAVRIVSSVAMLIGIALVIYGYISYHNPIIWMGILAVMVGLWWVALVSSGRSPVSVRI